MKIGRLGYLALLVVPWAPRVCGQIYSITDLGTLPGGTFSYGLAVNSAGRIVGQANDSLNQGRAFLWMKEAGMKSL